MSQRVPENDKPCIIMAEGHLCYLVLGSVFGNGYTINLSSVFKYYSVNKYIRDKKSMPKQLLRLKGHHVRDDASVRAMQCHN